MTDATGPRSDTRSRLIAASRHEVFAALRDPARVARWWGPAGFRNTIHRFDFEPGGAWQLTMHGPDGQDYPNASRFTRLVPDEVFEIEHLTGHHFVLTLELAARDGGTLVSWRQTFDTESHYRSIADFVAVANEQNLERLAAEVERGGAAATLEGACLCGALGWRYQGLPTSATACNCTACRRYGALWAYGYEGEGVHVTGDTKAYVRGDSLGFHFCPACGCIAWWRGLEPDREGRRRVAVNLRLTEPGPIAQVPVHHFDGLDTWDDLQPDGRCVRDMWF